MITSSQLEGLSFQSNRWQDFDIQSWIAKLAPEADYVSLRCIQETSQTRKVRNENPEPTRWNFEEGLLIEVMVDGHIGYAGTSSLSEEEIVQAFQRAKSFTQLTSKKKVHHFPPSVRPGSRGVYRTESRKSLDSWSLVELNDFLKQCSGAMAISPLITQRSAEVTMTKLRSTFANSAGALTDQEFSFVVSNFVATAQEGTENQRRSSHGPVSECYQGGLEWIQRFDEKYFAKIAEEALQLLKADNCPSGRMDTILAPDQMYLQIHESIGHPLELDRILGDERNYAGWSFVKPNDFGQLQYGSPILNVYFDPSVKGEMASYSFDDSGAPATREYLIKNGKLLRGLGGLESQQRSGIPGVANFRTASWNRAPIDRMANINVEAGQDSLQDLIASVENGIIMESNLSWSIDDYRDKFQFGCEFARLIQDGKLGAVVKNPNYRGRTLDFWRSLKKVSSLESWEMYGSPYCGKGEPSQMIKVGHGSPYCLFSQLEVFGG